MGTTSTIEDKTADYAAVEANSGRIWEDTDEAAATVKAVVESTSGSPPAAVYEVKTFTVS
jgi:hypothetical protein